ncbi:MAG: protein translocase subunit SecD [Candidatus Humimicrobiaceae bacterium]
MRNKKLHITILIILAAIIGTCIYYAYPFASSIELGLDLKGGTQIILKPTDVEEGGVTQESLDKAMLIIRGRIDKLGISEPLITRDYSDNIVVQLPGVKDPDRALEVIGKTAQLEFRILEGVFVSSEGPVTFDTDTGNFSADPQETEIYLYNTRSGAVESKVLSQEGDLLLAEPETEEVIGKFMPKTEDGKFFLIDPQTQETVGEILVDPGTGEASLLGPVLLTGDKLANAQAGYNPNGQIVVNMSFKTEGQEIFSEITEDNVGKQLAIVLDDEIKSAPVITKAIEGDAVIEGINSLQEAKNIALVLQTGALPVNLQIEENRTVGPTLGRDALTKGLYAGVIGFILIIMFMVSYYRGLGLISFINLSIYIILFWGILAGIGAALTLPGIAGIILTIGMAVDANVIIFERIKEEIKKGKSARMSINEGFRHGLRTIVDANVTTLITAAALYRFGTGPIRGFAVTLSLGVIISMLTCLVFSRSILYLLAGFKKVATPGFLGIWLGKRRSSS